MDRNHDRTPKTQLAPVPGASCRDTAGLLPWLVNGSLDEAERRALLDHLAGCESCRAELAQTVEAARISTQHVPSFALAEYAQGLTPGEVDRERIGAHLASCPDCREEVGLVRSTLGVADLAAARARKISPAPRVNQAPPAAQVRRTQTASGTRRRLTARRLTARRLTARRFAAAAALAAGLGVLLWNVRPAWLDAPPPGSDVDGAPAPATARLFSDGFESLDVSTWSEYSPGESESKDDSTQPNLLFADGFESSDGSTWSKVSG